MPKATDAQIAKGYQQVKDSLRKEIPLKEAQSRILAGLPVSIEETKNEQGHPVFHYFLERQ